MYTVIQRDSFFNKVRPSLCHGFHLLQLISGFKQTGIFFIFADNFFLSDHFLSCQTQDATQQAICVRNTCINLKRTGK